MVLLDTNVLVWMMGDRGKLSETAKEAIRGALRKGSVAIAGSSLWELAMLKQNDRLLLPHSLGDYLARVESSCVVLPLTGAIAERSIQFSDDYPRDPMDRIIGATALVHGLQLVSKDQAIRASGEVPCIW